jgi:N-acetylmuramoyl-L-alanine amidase
VNRWLVNKVVASPNFNDRKLPVSMVVLHYTGMRSAEEAIERLRDPEFGVSSHYLVAEDGQVVRMVPEDKRAWHAGVSSFQGRERCNDFSIGVELEGSDDDPFEAVQYEVLAGLARTLRTRYPIVHLAGHSDIAPGRKTDPGPCFDWQRLLAALAG